VVKKRIEVKEEGGKKGRDWIVFVKEKCGN